MHAPARSVAAGAASARQRTSGKAEPIEPDRALDEVRGHRDRM
jgi:hypothetical protein